MRLLSLRRQDQLKIVSTTTALTPQEFRELITPYDLKRLESYGNNMLDYHVILDLLPSLSTLYFTHRFPPDCKLSAVQSAILLAVGLQRKSVEEVEGWGQCYQARR